MGRWRLHSRAWGRRGGGIERVGEAGTSLVAAAAPWAPPCSCSASGGDCTASPSAQAPSVWTLLTWAALPAVRPTPGFHPWDEDSLLSQGCALGISPGLTLLVGQSTTAHTSQSPAAAACLAPSARQFPGHLNPAAGSAAGSTFSAGSHIQTGTGFRSGVNHLE